MLWIRIRMDPHNFGNLDPHPDPPPHQIKIRIRINLQMTSQYGKRSLFEHFFKVLCLYLDARIWIRIRIRVRVKVGSGSASGR